MVKNESGRSLVETLGMLAIMGILSVVGIAGYNAAVDKNRANTIINEAQKRATLVVPQILLMNNANPTITEFVNNDFGYGTFDTTVYTKSNLNAMPKNAFAIKVSNVPKNVCRNILNTIGEKTPIRRLSLEETPTLPITECNDDNTFLMIYNDDMLGENKNPPQSCHSHSDCGECGTCKKENEGDETGVCVGECESACSTQDECGENDCVVCDDETKTCQNKCEEVEYLESNGSQYIDTGVNADSNLNVEFRYKTNSLTTYQRIGAINSVGLKRHHFQIYSSPYAQYFASSNSNNTSVSIPTNTNIHTFYIDVLGQKAIYDGTTYNFSVTASTYDCGMNYWLFKRNADSVEYQTGFNGRIYHFKMYQSGSLVRDFVPVLSPQVGEEERKACMFDKVSKKLFCGVGTFDYGPKNNN